jgi:lipopolysaccharide export system ATP-binding protein
MSAPRREEPPVARVEARERLEAIGLVKSYHGRRVVDGVGFRVESGEVVGLLGPNGAGKTTSFYMVAGLLAPEAGQVILAGEDVGKLPMHLRARKGLSYLPQEASAFRGLSVKENLQAVAEVLPLAEADREQRVERMLKELSIAHLSRQKAITLSGGERRRVEIARALVSEPKFMLMDEPFAGVDPLAVADLQGIIRELCGRGIGVLITDHNVRETLKICDRAYIINEGRVLVEGPPAAIAADPRARRFYLGEGFTM